MIEEGEAIAEDGVDTVEEEVEAVMRRAAVMHKEEEEAQEVVIRVIMEQPHKTSTSLRCRRRIRRTPTSILPSRTRCSRR